MTSNQLLKRNMNCLKMMTLLVSSIHIQTYAYYLILDILLCNSHVHDGKSRLINIKREYYTVLLNTNWLYVFYISSPFSPFTHIRTPYAYIHLLFEKETKIYTLARTTAIYLSIVADSASFSFSFINMLYYKDVENVIDD